MLPLHTTGKMSLRIVANPLTPASNESKCFNRAVGHHISVELDLFRSRADVHDLATLAIECSRGRDDPHMVVQRAVLLATARRDMRIPVVPWPVATRAPAVPWYVSLGGGFMHECDELHRKSVSMQEGRCRRNGRIRTCVGPSPKDGGRPSYPTFRFGLLTSSVPRTDGQLPHTLRAACRAGRIVAGKGVEPSKCLAYEASDLPLVYPASVVTDLTVCRVLLQLIVFRPADATGLARFRWLNP